MCRFLCRVGGGRRRRRRRRLSRRLRRRAPVRRRRTDFHLRRPTRPTTGTPLFQGVGTEVCAGVYWSGRNTGTPLRRRLTFCNDHDDVEQRRNIHRRRPSTAATAAAADGDGGVVTIATPCRPRPRPAPVIPRRRRH